MSTITNERLREILTMNPNAPVSLIDPATYMEIARELLERRTAVGNIPDDARLAELERLRDDACVKFGRWNEVFCRPSEHPDSDVDAMRCEADEAMNAYHEVLWDAVPDIIAALREQRAEIGRLLSQLRDAEYRLEQRYHLREELEDACQVDKTAAPDEQIRQSVDYIARLTALARELAANICLSCNRSAASLWVDCDRGCDHRSRCVAVLLAGEPAPVETCAWTKDGDYLAGVCGIKWNYAYGMMAITSRDMNFCPRCGRRVEVKGAGE